VLGVFIFLGYRAFDAELLYIVQRLKIPVSEVAVNWTEIEGNQDFLTKLEKSIPKA
jgi:hypothetical protein